MVLFAAMIFIRISSAEPTVHYSYARVRYNWGVDEYSNYNGFVAVCDLTAQSVLIPLIAFFELNEPLIMTLIFASISVRRILQGLASHPWMFIAAAMCDILGSYSNAISRSNGRLIYLNETKGPFVCPANP